MNYTDATKCCCGHDLDPQDPKICLVLDSWGEEHRVPVWGPPKCTCHGIALSTLEWRAHIETGGPAGKLPCFCGVGRDHAWRPKGEPDDDHSQAS